jgi:hypothetical protein
MRTSGLTTLRIARERTLLSSHGHSAQGATTEEIVQNYDGVRLPDARRARAMSLCHLVSGKLAFGVQDVGDGHGILIVAIASKATSYLTAS